MSRSKQKGTAWETAIKRWLIDLGFQDVERRAQGPEGDIAGVEDWTIEAKNEKRIALAEYVTQLEAEMAKTGTAFGAVVVHRPRRSQPEDAYVVIPGWVWARLLKASQT